MKSKSQKKKDLHSLKEKFPKSSITVFTTFSRKGEKGLSVAQMRELKKSIKGEAEYFVTKKTLIEKTIQDLKYDGADVYGMDGSMGLVFSDGDAYAISKKLYDFSKKNPALQFFGAVFDGHFIDKDAFIEIAKMPSREVLLGRLVGMLTYPIRGLAVVLSEVAKGKEVTVS